MLWRSFVIFLLIRPFDLITTLTDVLMDVFCPYFYVKSVWKVKKDRIKTKNNMLDKSEKLKQIWRTFTFSPNLYKTKLDFLNIPSSLSFLSQ